jgi:multiple sugar transport system permease protein
MSKLGDRLFKDTVGLTPGAKRRYWSETLAAYLYLLPAILIIVTFHFFPIFYAFFISLNKWSILQERFVGLQNYARLLWDPDLWNSLLVTIWYALGTVPFALAISLFIAILLFQNIQGRGIFRTVYFLPNITSVVAAAVVWGWVFNAQYGVINYFLELIGLKPLQWILEPTGVFKMFLENLGLNVPEWAGGPSLALVAVMIMTIWSAIGFNMIIYLAGLGNISRELNEAARIDGATEWQVFRKITFPLLSPTTFFLLVVSVIRSFRAFDGIYAMTTRNGPAGGPLNTTRTVTVYIYNTAFGAGNPKMGYAAAAAFILMAVVLILTIVQFRYVGEKVHYE